MRRKTRLIAGFAIPSQTLSVLSILQRQSSALLKNISCWFPHYFGIPVRMVDEESNDDRANRKKKIIVLYAFESV